MSEQQLIEAAHEDGIRELYANFEDLWIAAKRASDAAGVQKAEQIFATGVLLRRQACERALALLPPSKP